MGALVTLKDLRVFRGTYAEIKDRPTEDKMVYLAWDTQELFIGNARGVKVKYGGVKNLENLLAESFEAFRNDVYQTIDTYASTKVEGILGETTEALTTRINDSVGALKSEKDEQISGLNEAISTLSTNTASRFSTMSGKIGEIENATNGLSETTTSLGNRLGYLEEESTVNFALVGGHSKSLETLQSSVDTLNTTVTSLKGSVDNVHFNTILYATGEDISSLVATLQEEDKLDTFIPTLCTEEFEDYLAGSIYYFNGTSIAASGTGGSGVIEHSANISAEFVNFDSRYESNSGNKTGRVMIAITGDESAIISYAVSLLKDGSPVVGYENLVNGQTILLTTESNAIYSLSISVVSTQNTTAHRYTVSTSTGSSIEIYTPVITNVRFVSNHTFREFNYIGTYTNIPIEIEAPLYIYSTQIISHVIFNGGLVDEELDFSEETSDLNGYQYKYNLGSDWFDTNLPSITLS